MNKCPKCGAAVTSAESMYGSGTVYSCSPCRCPVEFCVCDPTPTPAEPFTRHIRLTRASSIEPEPVVWAWEESGAGRIPAGSLSVAAGREGTGKSSFGIWMAAGITTGTLPGPMLGRPADVVYVAVEDSWKFTLVPRLIAAGADLDKVWRAEVAVSEIEVGTLNLPTDLSLLEATINEYGVRLVVLDPLLSLISEGIDTHKSRPVRTALDPLAALADRTGAVVLGIAHFNKGSGSDPSSLITGSGAFKDVPRSIFGFAVDQEDGSRVMTQTKNSLGKLDLPSLAYRIDSVKIETRKGIADVGRFVFDGEAARSVQDILSAASGDGDQGREKLEASEYLRAALADGWRKTTDVQEEAKQAHGISERTLNRARKGLAVIARKFPTGDKGKGEWWLCLPENATTVTEPKGATDDENAEQGANGHALTSEDCQGANSANVTQDWHPGTLALDSEPVSVPPDKPARRKCEAPGCRKNIPKTARADAKFCSAACRKRNNRIKSKEVLWPS